MPGEPPAAAPSPEAPPIADPNPVAPVAPAEPVPPPPGPTAPAAGAFPAPTPTPPPAQSAASAAPAAPPRPSAPLRRIDETPRPKRPTEGLFEEKGPPSAVHHHDDESDDDKVDQFKIGPVVGTGIPSVISFGGTLKVTRFLGAGVNVGLIPKVKLSYYGDATLSYQHYDIYGRLYPFGGGFFLGAGAGYATVDGTITKSFSQSGVTGRYDSTGNVRTLMLTALVGYFHTTSIGFSFGIDAGAQIPIAPSQIEYSSSLGGNFPAALRPTIEQQYLGPTDKSVRDTLERIGRTTLPTVNLRIGWIL